MDDRQELAGFDLKHDRDRLRQQFKGAIEALPNYRRTAACEYVACLERLVVLQRAAIEAPPAVERVEGQAGSTPHREQCGQTYPDGRCGKFKGHGGFHEVDAKCDLP